MKRVREKRDGFSLVELIVVIAILAVLVGVTVPQFFKYVNKNRAKACQVDREGILAVYERCVYGGELEVKTGDLEGLLKGDYPEIKDEVAQYKCPSGGSYTATVIVADKKAYIHCSVEGHEDVMIDFGAWSDEEETEGIDEPFPSPTKKPTSTVTKPVVTPTEPETPTTDEEDSLWPYEDDKRWNEGNGYYGGSTVVIDVPTAVFESKEGNQYVIIDKLQTGKFTITYEWAKGPEYVDSGGTGITNWEYAISCSGVTITEPTLNAEKNQILNVHYGDIVVCNGVKYIYATHSDTKDNWPLTGDKSGNFYKIGGQ